MSFNSDQIAELKKPLDPKHVKPPAPGKYGDYIQGWHVIDEANRIFGFDMWSREMVTMEETNRDLLTLKDKSGADYQQWRVGYLARVRINACGVIREGTGFGSGQGKPEALSDVIESAAKEAETDAMKRALMTFGYPFGLALYDKSKANVQAPPKEPEPPYEIELKLEEIAACDTQMALKRWWKDNSETVPPAYYDRILEATNKRAEGIRLMDQSAA